MGNSAMVHHLRAMPGLSRWFEFLCASGHGGTVTASHAVMRPPKFEIGQVVQVRDSVTHEANTEHYFRINYVCHHGDDIWLFSSHKSGPWFHENELSALTEKEKGPNAVGS